jgi:hypothetical protein
MTDIDVEKNKISNRSLALSCLSALSLHQGLSIKLLCRLILILYFQGALVVLTAFP